MNTAGRSLERQREKDHGARLHHIRRLPYDRRLSQGQMSSGDSSAVSMQRRQALPVRRDRRQLERQRFPIGVEHPVEQKAGTQASQREGKGVRVVAPVRAVERHSVPLDARPAKELIEAERGPFRHDITALAKCVERFDETVDVGMPLQQSSSRTS